MDCVVYSEIQFVEISALLWSNIVLVLTLMVGDADAYLASLLVLSAEFPEMVARNLLIGCVEPSLTAAKAPLDCSVARQVAPMRLRISVVYHRQPVGCGGD